MRPYRIPIAILVVGIFITIGGVLIYANQNPGGKDVTFSVTVTGAQSMKPDTLNANHNDNITLIVTSDRTGEVHLHGYDLHFLTTTAGQSVSRTFKADKTGDFEIEWESTSTHLGHLVVSG